MKRRLLMALAFAVFGAFAGAQVAPSSEQDTFLRLEQLWNDAHLRGDVKALEALWADDISIVVPSRRQFTKADALEMWRAIPVRFTRYESTDAAVRSFGEAAVITGRILRVRDFGGKTAEERWQFTKVYRRSAEGWRVVAFHASDAPK
jgi:ketosteroid isomerase-like protein